MAGPVLSFDDIPAVPKARGRVLSFDDAPVVQRETSSDPFAGEGFGSLASRRGQQVVEGAADVAGSIPESIAVTGAGADASRAREAGEFEERREGLIREAQEALKNPNLSDAARTMIERNIADMTVGQAELSRQADAEVVPAKDRPGFARGDAVRKAATDLVGTPDPRDTSIWADVAKGVGQVGAQIAIAAPAAILSGPAALATGGVIAAGQGQAQLYNEAVATGADEDTALLAARWGSLIGATEVIPIARALKIVPPRLRQKFEGEVLSRFSDIVQGAGEEAAQEALSQIAQNYVARELFDPDRALTEGVARGALVGGILGGGIGAVGTTINAALEPGPDLRTESPRLTPSDRSSPLPNAVIDDGKAAVDAILAGRASPSTPAAPPLDAPPQRLVAPVPPALPVPPQPISAPSDGAPSSSPSPIQPQPARADASSIPAPSEQDAPPVPPAAVTAPRVDAVAPPSLDSDRFETIPEVDMVNGEEVETGRMLRYDHETGRVNLIAPDAPVPPSTETAPTVDTSPAPRVLDFADIPVASSQETARAEAPPADAPSPDGMGGRGQTGDMGAGDATRGVQPAPDAQVQPDDSEQGVPDAGPGPAPETRDDADVDRPTDVARAPIPARPIRRDTAVTPAGRDVDVEYSVVEASDLIPSNLEDGRVNPMFPKERQPRDRSRGASASQVSGIANKLDPRLLDTNASTTDGAPIVDAGGVVESGNGRVMAIRQAYANVPASAEKYRDYLATQGYPVAGMTNPVLVRVRRSEMDEGEVAAFTRESNERTTAAMSATERAMTDAQAIPDGAMVLYRGGDIDSAGNRDFVRAFMQSAVSESDRGQMIDRAGSMSQDAVRRVQGAMLAKAYGEAGVVAKMMEAGDSNMKAIGGALMDIAPMWSQMRAMAAKGEIDASMDQTAALLEAVGVVDRARTSGRNVAEFTEQADLMSGEGLSDTARAFLTLMFRNVRQWTNPMGRPKMAEALQFYADEAMKTTGGADMFGATADPSATLATARSRIDGTNEAATEADLLARFSGSAREGDRASSEGRAGSALPPRQDAGSATSEGAREDGGTAGEVTPDVRSKEQRQPVATDTPAFKRWFGDSKVVDADGKPLVVYHGTRDRFEAFGPDKIASRFPMSAGFYATSSSEGASVYADSAANAAVGWNPESRFATPVALGAKVMPLYASIKNPFVIEGDFVTAEDVLDAQGGKVVRDARDAGHDGVIAKSKRGVTTIVAFRPEQIKSVFNNGNFNPTDARILEQRAPAGQGGFDLDAPAPKSGLSARDRAEFEARQRQSKIGRLDQERVEADGDSLFGFDAQGKFFDRRPDVDGAAPILTDLTPALPQLRKRLDDMGLKRVRLAMDIAMKSQGRFDVSSNGDMGILIGASLDPDKTLSHEAIHALRALDLFTETEWRDMSKRAEAEWLDRHDIEARYPDLDRESQIEEAIAEEFAAWSPDSAGSRQGLVASTFAKMQRLIDGVRAWLKGYGVTRPEDLFGDVASGRIGARGDGTVRRGGAANQVQPDQARDIDMDVDLPSEPLFAESVDNTPGASITNDGLLIDLVRYQKDEQMGATSVRTGVFYLPTGAATAKHYRNGKTGYGGAVEVRGETILKRPMFVKGATGGKAPEAAFDLLRGKGAYAAMRADAFSAYSAWGNGGRPDGDKIGEILSRYGADPDIAYDIAQYSSQGNLLAYAIQENIVAHAVREAGYDSVIGHSKSKGQPVIAEVFDVREVDYPTPGEPAALHPSFGLRPRNKRTKSKNQAQALTIDDRQSPRRVIRRPVQPSTTLGGGAYIPDRRVWEELSDNTTGAWSRVGGVWGASSDAIDRARIKAQDYFLPVLRAQEAVEKATGTILPDSLDAYGKETTFAGKVGRHLFEIDEDISKPIVEMIAATKGGLTVESVGEWLTAKHAAERNAHIASINPTMPDGGSGMTNAEAAKIISDAAAGPHARKLDTIAKLIADLRERSITLREDAGLLSPQEAAMWRRQYDHYVPLQGFADVELSDEAISGTGGGRSLSARKKESKRAMGRSSKAMNPLVMSIVQAQEAAIRAEKNRIAQSLVNLAEAYPSEAMWSIRKPKMKRVFNKVTGLVEGRMENPTQGPTPDNEISVKVAGKEVRLTLHDPRLATAVAGMGVQQVGAAVAMIRPIMRYMSMILTTLNPEFLVVNATRDFMEAQINIREMGGAEKNKIAKAMVTHWPRSFKAALRGQAGRTGTSAVQKKWDKYYTEFERSGAKVNFWKIDDGIETGVDMQKRVDLKGGTAMRRASRWVIPSTRDNPILDTIERVNLSTDNAIRLSAYVAARDAGWSQQKAAKLSKNMTVNFNRRGEWGAGLNTLFLFFNAAVQGTQVMFKVFSNPKMAVKYGGGLIAAGLALDMLNSAISDEDEDGELSYDKIPDWRNRITANMMIPNEWTPGDTSYAASVWLPYGYSVLPYIGQQIGKVSRGVKPKGDAMADVTAAAFTSYSPIQGEDFFTAITPTVLQPGLQLWMNRDRLGRPIMPENPYGNNGPDAYRFYGGASMASRTIADGMNRATGGTTQEKGLLDISPETLDHLAGTATGGLGKFTGNTFDAIVKTVSGRPEEVDLNRLPFVRKVFTATGSWQDRERFYRFREDVKEAAAQAKGYGEEGQPVPEPISRLAQLAPALRSVESQLRPIRKTRQFMIEAGRPARDTRDERKRMDGVEARAMIAFNRAYIAAAGPQAE